MCSVSGASLWERIITTTVTNMEKGELSDADCVACVRMTHCSHAHARRFFDERTIYIRFQVDSQSMINRAPYIAAPAYIRQTRRPPVGAGYFRYFGFSRQSDGVLYIRVNSARRQHKPIEHIAEQRMQIHMSSLEAKYFTHLFTVTG